MGHWGPGADWRGPRHVSAVLQGAGACRGLHEDGAPGELRAHQAQLTGHAAAHIRGSVQWGTKLLASGRCGGGGL